MLERATGRATVDLYVLGTTKIPIFLTGSADEWTIIEGGLSWMVPLVLRQIDQVLPSREHVRHWVLVHSHYDHTGMLGSLYAEMPWLRVHATAPVAKALRSARAREVVRDLNDQVTTLPGFDQGTAIVSSPGGLRPPVPADQIPCEIVADGDAIVLDRGRRLRALETPGHSRCSASFFDELAGRAYVSDALGELGGDHRFYPLAFDVLEDYRRSIRKIGVLGATTLLLAHHAILTGEHAAAAPGEAYEALDDFARQAARLLAKMDQKSASRELSLMFRDVSAPFVPAPLHEGSVSRMIDLLRGEGTLAP